MFPPNYDSFVDGACAGAVGGVIREFTFVAGSIRCSLKSGECLPKLEKNALQRGGLWFLVATLCICVGALVAGSVATSLFASPLDPRNSGILIGIGLLTPFGGIVRVLTSPIFFPRISKLLKPIVDDIFDNNSSTGASALSSPQVANEDIRLEAKPRAGRQPKKPNTKSKYRSKKGKR